MDGRRVKLHTTELRVGKLDFASWLIRNEAAAKGEWRSRVSRAERESAERKLGRCEPVS